MRGSREVDSVPDFIYSGKDTLFVNDFWSLDSVRVVKRQFLEVFYAHRVGSGQGRENYILLSVKDHRLIESAYMSNEYDCSDIECFSYNIKPTIIGDNPKNFRLALDFSAEKSTLSGQYIYSDHHLDTLSFDPNAYVFFSQKKRTPIIKLQSLPFYPDRELAAPDTFYFTKGVWQYDETDNDEEQPVTRQTRRR
ncbi:MAG TPA: hypothetical protein VG101_19500 [Puia sp.]|nr:hypothetical protein [Puia sp.]